MNTTPYIVILKAFAKQVTPTVQNLILTLQQQLQHTSLNTKFVLNSNLAKAVLASTVGFL
jgi:hypothetical protein